MGTSSIYHKKNQNQKN